MRFFAEKKEKNVNRTTYRSFDHGNELSREGNTLSNEMPGVGTKSTQLEALAGKLKVVNEIVNLFKWEFRSFYGKNRMFPIGKRKKKRTTNKRSVQSTSDVSDRIFVKCKYKNYNRVFILALFRKV